MEISNEIRVGTDALRGWADLVASDVSRMEELVRQLGEVVRRTGSYWTGEAGDQYRNSYLGQEEARQEILRQFNEDPDKLTQIAEIFSGAIKSGTQMAAGLPADVCGGRGF